MTEMPTEPASVSTIPMAAISTGGHEPTIGPAERLRNEGFNWLLLGTFLSPATIAVSFWYLYDPGVGILATLTILLTLAASVVSSVKLAGGGIAIAPAGRLLDGVAGAALLVMAIIPLGFRSHVAMDNETNFLPAVAFAFALITLATPRFIFYYRAMATFARMSGRIGLARFATTIGTLKLVEEFILLGSVALFSGLLHFNQGSNATILFAFVALGGVAGYGVIWIATLVLHLRLRSLAAHPTHARPTGFDVLVKPLAATPMGRV